MSKTVFNWRTLLLAFIVLAVMNMFLKSCKKSYLEGDAAPAPSIDATKKELEKYFFEKKDAMQLQKLFQLIVHSYFAHSS